MINYTTFIGLDAHKKSISVALKISRKNEYVEFKVPYTEAGIKKMVKKINKDSIGSTLSCYEAGPCGYGLQRKLEGKGLDCIVIAPSLIPVKRW